MNTLFIDIHKNKSKNLADHKDSDDELENDYQLDEAMYVKQTNDRRYGLKPTDPRLNAENKKPFIKS